jgi:hypothetical protein
MSATLMVGLVFVLICVFYGIASHFYAKTETAIVTEAGATSDKVGSSVITRKVPAQVVRLENGKYIRTRDYIRIIVDGDCMSPRNILRNEEWLVEPVKSSDLETKLQKKDVVLIFLEDKQMYKIREFEGYDSEGNLTTLYYDENSRKRYSSHPHPKSSVRGILRYAI